MKTARLLAALVILGASIAPAFAQQAQQPPRYDQYGQQLQQPQQRAPQAKQPQQPQQQKQRPIARQQQVEEAEPVAQQPQQQQVAAPAQQQQQPSFIVPQAPAPTIVNNPAAPAKPSGGIINIGQSLNETLGPIVNDVVNMLLLAAVTAAGVWWKQKTGKEIDKSISDRVARGLQNQAGALLAAGAVRLDGLKIDVKNADLANAANELLKSFPDAQKHFGFTSDWVKERILAAIPQTAAGATLLAQAHADAPKT